MSDDVLKTEKKRGGWTKAGPGRPKGMQNKITVEFRETVRRVLESNADNVGLWLQSVANNDPGKALDLLTKLAEFAAPKLSRQEVSADISNSDGSLRPAVIQIVAAKPNDNGTD